MTSCQDCSAWERNDTISCSRRIPAELRPTGGYSGQWGPATLKDGAITAMRFRNVNELDFRGDDLPYVRPPDELAITCWATTSRGDSPTPTGRPTSRSPPARPSSCTRWRRAYSDIDGVIAVTTFALDRLLEVVGPVRVDDFGVTVEPGT